MSTSSRSSKDELGKKFAGVAAIYAIEKMVAKGLAKGNSKIPSSLVTMLLWLGGLKVIERVNGEEQAELISQSLTPAVNYLGKWMTLYLTPPLVMLPVAIKRDAKGTTASTWGKVLVIHCAGWALSCVASALMAFSLDKRRRSNEVTKSVNLSRDCSSPSPSSIDGVEKITMGFQETEMTDGDIGYIGDSDSNFELGEFAKRSDEILLKKDTSKDATTTEPENKDQCLDTWVKLAIAALALNKTVGLQPLAFATTASALIGAKQLLPPSVSKVLHPIVASAAATWGVLGAMAWDRGVSLDTILKEYMRPDKKGAGDLLNMLLNASVSSLGIRMYSEWAVLSKNWKPLLGASSFGAILSLFGTAWVAGKAKIPTNLGLPLVQRSVMSGLGMSGAGMVGASESLAVAGILITGVYGASFGGKLMDFIGLKAQPKDGHDENSVVRGAAMGSSAHAIGTAALLSTEPEAAAVSSVALCLTGIVHIALLTHPSSRQLVRKLAKGTVEQ